MDLTLLIVSVAPALVLVAVVRTLGRRGDAFEAAEPVFQPREPTPYELTKAGRGRS
ncbi:hypothetical protein ACFQ08_06350 [Streptosporangium algeriense]|uniref:Cbb3-type cytochrome oxidase assembly protein CcoS n=1 Tax=Streptosporangium algeriense TaxID=1682748 RepID=A0ABW3DMH1_9ACTN